MEVKLKWEGDQEEEEEIEIDVFVEMRVGEREVCEVGFYNQRCEGVSWKIEKGEQSIRFEGIGKHKYFIYVGQYLNST